MLINGELLLVSEDLITSKEGHKNYSCSPLIILSGAGAVFHFCHLLKVRAAVAVSMRGAALEHSLSAQQTATEVLVI